MSTAKNLLKRPTIKNNNKILKTLELLLSHGGNVNVALYEAMFWRIDIVPGLVEMLLAKDIDIHWRDKVSK